MNLQTFTLFQYGKKGDAEQVLLSKRIISHVKAGRLDFLNNYFDKIITEENAKLLTEFIPTTSTLVPLPKSAPLLEGSQWPPKEICKYLLSRNYGESVIELLNRVKVVPKAAFQHTSEDRPSVELHCNTIEFKRDEIHSNSISNIVLVDDVVTQGRTAYACYKIIREYLPDTPISLFCLVRTNTFTDIVKCNEPKRGEILYYESGKTFYRNIEPPGIEQTLF